MEAPPHVCVGWSGVGACQGGGHGGGTQGTGLQREAPREEPSPPSAVVPVACPCADEVWVWCVWGVKVTDKVAEASTKAINAAKEVTHIQTRPIGTP